MSNTLEIIVVSDSHGLIKPLLKVRQVYPHADAYLHCGDSELHPKQLDGFKSVLGNNDDPYFERELAVNVKGTMIYLTHSHLFGYHNRLEEMANRAKSLGCSIVLFGHSHVFTHSKVNGIDLINPGSLRYNRDGTPVCFARVLIRDEQVVMVERIDLNSLEE